MAERIRIGFIILLVNIFFIVPVLYVSLVAWAGQIACVSVTLLLVLGAFCFVRVNTPDWILLLLGQAVQIISAGAWYLIGSRLRLTVAVLGDTYHRTQDFSFDMEVVVVILLAGVGQSVLLYFFRNAVREDKGWNG